MYELNASNYHEVVTTLQLTLSRIDGHASFSQTDSMGTEQINWAVNLLTKMAQAIAPLHVPITAMAAMECLKHLEPGKLTFGQFGVLLLSISDTLRRELTIRKVFCLDANRADFYAPSEPLWGIEVANKFPGIAYEIDQSGKCYACDLTTASAFHSVRALEAGIRAITRCLGIPDPTTGKERNWSSVSGSIKTAIDKRWPSFTGRMSGDGHLFDKLYGAIVGMQNPYRNETMHLSATYTAPEALHILELVKGLMQKIASRMDENGEPKA